MGSPKNNKFSNSTGGYLPRLDASARGSILNKYSGYAINVIEEMGMNSYQWPSERQAFRRVNQIEGVEAMTNVFKLEMSVLRKYITEFMKPKEEVQEIIQMKNNEVRVVYPLEEINYVEEKSSMYPGGPLYLEYDSMQKKKQYYNQGGQARLEGGFQPKYQCNNSYSNLYYGNSNYLTPRVLAN